MAKGGRGAPFNGPSKTGNPSGKGRGNNPPRASGGFGFYGGGKPSALVTFPLSPAARYAQDARDAAIAKLDGRIRHTEVVARMILSVAKTLPPEQLTKYIREATKGMNDSQLAVLKLKLTSRR